MIWRFFLFPWKTSSCLLIGRPFTPSTPHPLSYLIFFCSRTTKQKKTFCPLQNHYFCFLCVFPIAYAWKMLFKILSFVHYMYFSRFALFVQCVTERDTKSNTKSELEGKEHKLKIERVIELF